MNEAIEEELIDAEAVGTLTCDPLDPRYDPLEANTSFGASEDCLNNNSNSRKNNEIDCEDFELSITGSVIKTNHTALLSNNNNKNKSDQNASFEDDVDDDDDQMLGNDDIDIEDLEDLIKCEKINIKEIENQIKKTEDEIESDILSEVEDENVTESVKENLITKSDVELSKEAANDISVAVEAVAVNNTSTNTVVAESSVPIIDKLPPESIDTPTTTTPPHSPSTNFKLNDNNVDIETVISTGLVLDVSTTTTNSQNAAPQTAPSQETSVDDITEGEEELRSDGSDSGLGSEPSHNTSLSLLCERSSPKALPLPPPQPPSSPKSGLPVQRPPKSSLKRRSSDDLDGATAGNGATVATISCKRQKRNIQFTGVTVYLFPRQQGFSCIPSQGGCSLGMGNVHSQVR